jgi:biopolymer transport protein ExbD
MAGVDLGGGRPAKKAKGGLKRPKRRIGIRIDMTPMVDIAFLLLIFYMVTTIFSAPLSMEIALPPKPELGEPPTELKLAESHLLQIFVDKSDGFYYQIGKMKQPQKVSFAELVKTIEEKTRLEMKDLVIVLKLDQAASYKQMVNIIDSIQDMERKINTELNPTGVQNPNIQRFSSKFSLQDMTAWDEHVLEVVRAGGTVEIE